MKRVLTIFAIAITLLGSNELKAQEVCDSLPAICSNLMSATDDGSIFVSDGQMHQTRLGGDAAEFETTLYGGSTYRIATSAGTGDNYVIFTVYDLNGEALFTNKKYNNSPYWDFQVTSTIPVKIEVKLDEDKKASGCVALMIGFKK